MADGGPRFPTPAYNGTAASPASSCWNASLDVSLMREGGSQIHSCQLKIGVMDFSKGDKKKLQSIDSWLVEPEVPSPFLKNIISKQYKNDIFDVMNGDKEDEQMQEEEKK